MHWRCSEGAGYTMLRLHNCCSWTHPSHLWSSKPKLRSMSHCPSHFGHLTSASLTSPPLSSRDINSAVHLKPPLLRQPSLREKINCLNQSRRCCYWRARLFAEPFSHKSSMRSVSGSAMLVIAFIFLPVCSSAMLLWELHRREQRALGL